MIGFALAVYLAGGLILVAIHRWAPVWFSLSPANVSMAAVLILAKAFLALDPRVREHGVLYPARGRGHEVGADHRRHVHLAGAGAC